MKVKDLMNNPGLKKGFGIASAIVMGVITISDALSEQKKDQEFEEMKKDIEELKQK